MRARRSPLEIYRDALLVLAMEQTPMKRTRFMYAMNLSWKPTQELLGDLLEKALIRMVDPREVLPRRWRRIDKRSKFLVGITAKGHWVLRWLDILLKYIREGEPNVRPPLWILQTLFRGRLESLKLEELPDFSLDSPMDVRLPGLEFRLHPPRLLGQRTLHAKFVVASYRVIDPRAPRVYSVPRSWVLRKAFQDLRAEFSLMRAKKTMHCPECGIECSSLHGLKIHVGRMHSEKKEALLGAIRKYLRT